MSALEGKELYANCALSLSWWEGSLDGWFICNPLKSCEINPIQGGVVTIVHSSSAAVLVLVKERKSPFSVAGRCHSLQPPHRLGTAARLRESPVLWDGDFSELSGPCRA